MWRNHAKPTRLIRKYRWYISIFLNIRCQDLVQPTSHSSITTHTVGPQVVGDVTTDRKWPNDHVGKIYFLQADRGSNLYTEHFKIAACFCITVCCMSQSFMILDFPFIMSRQNVYVPLLRYYDVAYGHVFCRCQQRLELNISSDKASVYQLS